MKIVFWGTPKYAAENLVSIVEAGLNVAAVITQPDRRRSRGKKLYPSPVKQAANDYHIPVYTTSSIRKDQQIKNVLFNLNADVYIVVAFGQILPKEILDQPKLGSWNSHASLLPLWRGAAPIQWSIINNDKKTGICIMAMDEGLDTGPIIERETIDIYDTDNLEILSNRLSNISSRLLVKSLERIKLTIGLTENERLNQLKAIDQSKLKGKPCYARQIKKEDYLIDWNEKANKIVSKIKGLYPNAYTIHKGKRIKILQANLLESHQFSDKNLFTEGKELIKKTPGEIIMVSKKQGVLIMTQDYPILIKNGQLEGKKITDGYTLSLQSKIEIDNIIGN